MLDIVVNLIGIIFFTILAASGFTLTAQIFLWVSVFVFSVLTFITWITVEHNKNLYKSGKRLSKDFIQMIPLLANTDFDTKCAHIFCASIIIAIIAFYLLHVVFLSIAIIAVMILRIVVLQNIKEFIRNVENDPSHEQ